MIFRVVKFYIYLICSLVLLPLMVMKVLEGSLLIATLELGLFILLAITAFQLYRYKSLWFNDLLVMICVTAVFGVTLHSHAPGVYFFSYPIIIAYYFILNYRHALFLNVLLLFILFPYGISEFEAFTLARFFITLSVTSMFAYTFASLLTKKNMDLDKLASTDTLTGLPNRRAMEIALEKEQQRLKRNKAHCTLLVIDIDHFKQINDEFGHDSGDIALQKVSELLQQRLRQSDEIFRYGGEEFVVMLPYTEEFHGLLLAEFFRELVANTRIIAQRKVTISIGVTEMQPDEDWHRSISRADQHLYLAKQNGRNQCMSDDRASAIGLKAS